MNRYLNRKNANENEKASNEKKSKSMIRHYSDSYIVNRRFSGLNGAGTGPDNKKSG